MEPTVGYFALVDLFEYVFVVQIVVLHTVKSFIKLPDILTGKYLYRKRNLDG